MSTSAPWMEGYQENFEGWYIYEMMKKVIGFPPPWFQGRHDDLYHEVPKVQELAHKIAAKMVEKQGVSFEDAARTIKSHELNGYQILKLSKSLGLI